MSFWSSISNAVGGAVQSVTGAVSSAVSNINIGNVASTLLQGVPGGSLINGVLQNGWSSLNLNSVLQTLPNIATSFIPVGSVLSSSLIQLGTNLVNNSVSPIVSNTNQTASNVNSKLSAVKQLIDAGGVKSQSQLTQLFSDNGLGVPPIQWRDYLTEYLKTLNTTNTLNTISSVNQLAAETPSTNSRIVTFIKNNWIWLLLPFPFVILFIFLNRKKSRYGFRK